MARTIENKMWIIRADVAGATSELASAGSSGIVRPDGSLVMGAARLGEDFLVADVGPTEKLDAALIARSSRLA